MTSIGISTQVRGLRSVLLGAALAFCWTVSGDATPTVPATILLKIPGITGTSQISGHVGDIVLTGFSANDTHSVTTGGLGGGAGKAVCGQVTITKQIDQTSPEFLRRLFLGQLTPSATIIFETPSNGESTPVDFYTVDLAQVEVTSVTQTDPQADLVTETIVLHAVTFKFTFFPSDGKVVSFGWDCATNRAL